MNRGTSRTGGAAAILILSLLALSLSLPACAGTSEGDEDASRPVVRKARKEGPSIRKPPSGRRPLGRPKTAPRTGELAAKDKKIEEQQKRIGKLQKDLKERDDELARLNERVEALSAGAGSEEAVERLTILQQEREKLEKQLEEEKRLHEEEVGKLQAQLNAVAAVEGGANLPKLVKERDEAIQERDDAKSELAAVQMMRTDMMKQIEDLSKEMSGFDEKYAALQSDKERVQGERDRLEQQVEKLEADLDEAKNATALAEDNQKSGLEEMRNRLDTLQKEKVRLDGEIAAVKKQAGDAGGKVGKAKAAGLIGFFAGLAAIGLGVFLFFTIRTLKYEVAVAQARSGGDLDPAEVEQIVSAQMSELASNLPTMGAGGDLEGAVGDSVKKALSEEMKSEAFQKRVQELVPAGGGGGKGGGGLGPQEVKIMVDNQFRAITTYLKNEAVPKMVEDALKKKAT